MLIVLGGLPGTGKTSIAHAVLAHCAAAYVRIDEIEQALKASKVLAGDVGPAGYVVGYALARSNLQLGQTVLVDCVNPLAETREAWRAVAAITASALLEVEIICSDATEHRRRVEHRTADIAGHVLPTWESVSRHDYTPWTSPRLVIDTATTSASDAASLILSQRH
jgi:predicted kinase